MAFYWLSHAMGQMSDEEYSRTAPGFSQLSEPRQRAEVQGFLERNMTCEGLT